MDIEMCAIVADSWGKIDSLQYVDNQMLPGPVRVILYSQKDAQLSNRFLEFEQPLRKSH